MDTVKNTHCPINKIERCKYLLGIFAQFVLGLVASILFLLFLFLSIPIFLFRFAVIFYAKHFRKDLDQILSGLSAYFCNDYFDNETPRANAVIPLIIRGHVNLEELKQLVKSRWIETNDTRFKHFCQYPVRWTGFAFYKKAADSFHVDNHVYLYSRDEEGIRAGHVTEEEVNKFTEKLLNSPFTPCKSPWEIHLVQNYKNGKSFPDSQQLSVFILKIHHSLADGFALMAAFLQAFSQQTAADLKIPKPRFQKRTYTSYFLFSIKLITEIGYFAFQTLKSNPWKVPDDTKQWHQLSFQSELIPLQKLRTIRDEFGISFSNILLSAVSSALQNCLYDSSYLTRKKKSDMMLEKFKDNSIYCSQVLPLPDHPMSLTNHFTANFFDLPIRKYDKTIDRLQEVDLVLRSGRNNSCPWALPWLSYALAGHLYHVSKFVLKNRTISIGVTNFPMNPLHFEINGKKAIAASLTVGGLDGVTGLAVMFLSYGKYVRITATAEATLMKRDDINTFGKYIMEEIERVYLMASSVAK